MHSDCPGLSLDQFPPFLDCLPLGIHIWRLEDPDDCESLCLLAANELMDEYVLKPTTAMVGQRILNVFPLLANTRILELLKQIAIAQRRHHTEEITEIDGVPMGLYSATAFALPDRCVAVVFQDVTHHKRATEALAESSHDLQERVKELTCLLGVLQIGADPQLSLDTILMQIIDLLPSAWQVPELAAACLCLNGREYSTANYRSSPWMQCTPVSIRGQEIGLLQIVYLSDGVIDINTPFLKEEQTLLEAVASRIAWVIERKQSEAAQHEQHVLLEALQDTASVLNSTLNIHEVLDRILESIGRVVPHDAVNIMLVENDSARVVKSVGYDRLGFGNHAKQFTQAILNTPLLREMVSTRQPVLLGDLQPESLSAEWESFPLAFKSYLGTPILFDNKVIGFINLNGVEPDFFTETDVRRLMSFTDQAAIAIRNARLHDEVEERNRHLVALNEITHISNDTPDLEKLLRNLADKVVEITRADHCFVTLWSEEQKQAYPAAASGDNHEPFLGIKVLAGEPTLTRLVLEAGEPIIRRLWEELPYSPESTAAIRHILKGEWILIVPLQAASIPLGSVLISVEDQHALTDLEVEWIKQAAELTSLAIARAHAFNLMEAKVEERTEKLRVSNMLLRKQISERRAAELAEREQRVLAEALQATAAILNSTLNLDEVLEQILENVGRVVPHDCANIMLVEQGTASLARSRGYELLGAKDALLGVYFPANSMFDMRQLIEAGEPVLFRDTQANPEWARVAESRWVRSYVGSPIRMDGEVIGFLNLDSATPDFFDPLHVERLQAFADQAAVAIKNARLYEQAKKLAVLEERERLARDLHDAVSQTLWSASLIADVLPTLWERDPEEGKRNLEQLQDLTQVARDEMRSLLLDLRPGMLSQMALRDLITQLVKTLGGRTSADFHVNITGSAELPAPVQINLYRIAQEALNNVVKHAHASRVDVDLTMHEAGVLLRIRDNGHGFNPNQILAGHFGRHIMVERAQAIGAAFSIESLPGEGAEVRVHWLRNKEKA